MRVESITSSSTGGSEKPCRSTESTSSRASPIPSGTRPPRIPRPSTSSIESPESSECTTMVPSKFMTLAFFAVMRRSRDLYLIAAGTLAGVLAVAAGPACWSVGCLTLPLLLVYPGYALLAASATDQSDAVEGYTIVLGVGIVCAVLGGVVLHLTPWGLQPLSWVVLLAAITSFGCV